MAEECKFDSVRMTAVLAQVHKAVVAVAVAEDDDLDPTLAAGMELGSRVRTWPRRKSP